MDGRTLCLYEGKHDCSATSAEQHVSLITPLSPSPDPPAESRGRCSWSAHRAGRVRLVRPSLDEGQRLVAREGQAAAKILAYLGSVHRQVSRDTLLKMRQFQRKSQQFTSIKLHKIARTYDFIYINTSRLRHSTNCEALPPAEQVTTRC